MATALLAGFAAIAGLMTLFQSFFAKDIFAPDEEWGFTRFIFQWWVSLFCSLTGWACLYLLLFERLKLVAGTQMLTVPFGPEGLGWLDAVLFFTALFGVTGYLPLFLMSLAMSPTAVKKWMGGK